MSRKRREQSAAYLRKGPPIIANEAPSRTLGPVRFTGADGLGEHWECPEYYGLLRRFPVGSPIGGGEFAVISISATDETARHDWREFQQLKNMLVGQEWEALELYPAESRLKDPSNRFYLWCFPAATVPWGLPGGRSVVDDGKTGAPQRPFPRMAEAV